MSKLGVPRFKFIVLVLSLVSIAAADWKPIDPSRKFAFPSDHSSHPETRIEWWYYTGNLQTTNGRRFGYQLTFFRVGVDPSPANPSRWAVRDLHMAHFAISDIGNSRFQFAELLNRSGIGWAGSLTDRYRVWNEDWSAELSDAGHHILRAQRDDIAIELDLESLKPPVLHGINGYSQKGTQPGNASSYYSLTRMNTRGRLTAGGETLDVEGLSWMDHEFGTTFLEKGQIGWDWFALQLDEGTELMFYSFRRNDSKPDPQSSGTFVEVNGHSLRLDAADVTLEKRRTWTSPSSRAIYPVEWKFKVSSRSIDLTIQSAFDDQELHTFQSTGVMYWEGAVTISGTSQGRGYLEMTGYAGQTLDCVLN